METNQRAGRSVVWFSEEGLSKPLEENNWVFAESEGAYAAFHVSDSGYTWEEGNGRT